MSAVSELGINNAEPWRSPRCFVLGFGALFSIDRSQLWIDALHIQVIDDHWTESAAITVEYLGHAYMTNTVVQGNPSSESRFRAAISASAGTGGIYAEGTQD